MSPDQFAVVQTTFDVIPTELFEQTLIAHTKWPRIDIKRLALQGQGILANRFSHGEATAVRAAFERAGFPTRIIPVTHMMSLPHARSIAWADISPIELGVPLDAHQETATQVPWTSVFAIHAAMVAHIQETTEMVEAETSDWRHPAHDIRKSSYGLVCPMLGFLALSAQGQMLHVRLSLARFFLNRMPWLDPQLSRPDQFRAVLALLIHHSTRAIVSPSAHELAKAIPRDSGERQPVSRVDRDDRAFQATMNWLLQLLTPT